MTKEIAVTEINAEVTRIVTEFRKTIHFSRQHAISKIHAAKLNELGLGDFVGSIITGNSEAQEVIKEATTGKTSGSFMNAYGEGEDWTVGATALFKLLNPAPAPVETELTAIFNAVDAIGAAKKVERDGGEAVEAEMGRVEYALTYTPYADKYSDLHALVADGEALIADGYVVRSDLTGATKDEVIAALPPENIGFEIMRNVILREMKRQPYRAYYAIKA